MFLVGDIGNTEVKVFLLNKKYKLKKKIILKTNKINKTEVNRKLFPSLIKIKKLDEILFCSVVPNVFKLFKKFFKDKFNYKCIELKQLNISKYIDVSVNKKQVGSDRIANAIGALKKSKNTIIIDLGTATTFDVIKNNIYLGGVIAPGLSLSLSTLSRSAKLIPKVILLKPKNIIGKNTNEAVRSGFYWGYIGLINNIIKLILKKTNSKFNIIVTGGFAHLFTDTIAYPSILDKELTLKGLISILKNKK